MPANDSSAGALAAISLGTLFVLYLVWGAMHDIAHGESDPTFEYIVLAISVPAFALLYRSALSILAPTARMAWLGGTGLVILLFDVGAVSVRLHPKYSPDPVLASAFLMAGVPVLGLIAYHFAREASRLRRSRSGQL